MAFYYSAGERNSLLPQKMQGGRIQVKNPCSFVLYAAFHCE